MGVPLLSGISQFLEIQEKVLGGGDFNFNGDSAILGNTTSKISLFGATPVSRQSATDLSGVVSALKYYGFIK